jgi:hypothetical protein
MRTSWYRRWHRQCILSGMNKSNTNDIACLKRREAEVRAGMAEKGGENHE